MTELARNRVARALDLIPFIVSHPGTSVADLAQIFNATQKEIAKDLTLLHMCGLPGYTHLELLDLSYENPDFVEVINPQVLDKPRSLSRSEAVSLVLGLDLLAKLTVEPKILSELLELRNRIAKVSSSSTEKPIAKVENPSASETESLAVSLIVQAIAESKELRLQYISGGTSAPTSKLIAPLSLEQSRGHTYLDAIDLELSQRRTYRLDRITSIALGEGLDFDGFILKTSTGLSNSSANDRARDTGNRTEEVSPLLRIAPVRIGRLFAEDHQGIVESNTIKGDSCLIQLTPVSKEWLMRTLLSRDGHVEFVNETRLQTEFETIARGLLRRYDFPTEQIGRGE
jgi:predicted DNA-binding transcriptional regulator YafY